MAALATQSLASSAEKSLSMSCATASYLLIVRAVATSALKVALMRGEHINGASAIAHICTQLDKDLNHCQPYTYHHEVKSAQPFRPWVVVTNGGKPKRRWSGWLNT